MIGKLFRKRVSGFEPFTEFKKKLYRSLPLDLTGFRVHEEDGLVSVVLPVYNGARYVRESIDSVVSQTYARWELIVVDDGSTDDTPAILASYSDPRIRVLRREHIGLPAALTEGFRHARGEFHTWTSDDNQFDPKHFATLLQWLQKRTDVDMVYADEVIIDEHGSVLRNDEFWAQFQDPPGSGIVRFPMDPGRLNFEQCNYIGASFLYRASAGRIVGQYDAALQGYEDYDYWMRMNALLRIAHAGRIEPLYRYRVHPRSLTAKHKEMDVFKRVARHLEHDRWRRNVFLQPFCILYDGGHPWFRTLQRAWKPFHDLSSKKRILITASEGDLEVRLADKEVWTMGRDFTGHRPESLLYPVLAGANAAAVR